VAPTIRTTLGSGALLLSDEPVPPLDWWRTHDLLGTAPAGAAERTAEQRLRQRTGS